MPTIAAVIKQSSQPSARRDRLMYNRSDTRIMPIASVIKEQASNLGPLSTRSSDDMFEKLHSMASITITVGRPFSFVPKTPLLEMS